MLWALLLFGHLVGIVGYTLLLRESAAGKMNKILLSAVMQTGIFLPSLWFLYTGQVSFDHTVHEWCFLILGGFMVAGLMVTNVWALSKLDAALFTIIYNLRLLGTTILGFLILHELPNPLQLAGGIVILASIFMLHLERVTKRQHIPILIGVFTMIWFSFHAVLEKYNLHQLDFASYFFTFSLIGAALLWILTFMQGVPIRKELRHLNNKHTFWLLITRALSVYTYTYALLYGSLAVTNYVSGMSVALIVLFDIYLLHETKYKKRKLKAVGIACTGLTLILLGRIIY